MGYRNFILVILFLPVFAFAQSNSSVQSRIKKVKSQISSYQSELSNLKEDSRDVIAKLNTLDRLIQKQQSLVNNLQKENKSLGIKIDSLKIAYTSNIDLLKRSQKEYGNILMAMYKKRTAFSLWMFILSANTFNEAYKRFIYLAQYSEYRRNHASNIIKTTQHINDLLKDIEFRKTRQAEILDIEITELNELVNSKNAKKSFLGKIEKNTKKIRESIARLEKENKNLTSELKHIETEILKEQNTNKTETKTISKQSASYSELFLKSKGKLNWPVEKGVIVVYFGKNTHPDLKNIFTINDGVDIKITQGKRVRTIAGGVVKKVLAIPGLNSTVIIQHGEYFTLYSNIVDVSVKPGAVVTESMVIGNIYTNSDDENSGILKFQVWKNTEKLNPILWLKKNP